MEFLKFDMSRCDLCGQCMEKCPFGALQMEKDGITVNNMAPGVIATDRNVEALSDPVYARQVADSIPVGFYGEPKDCAGAVLLLCSDEGRYITGQSLYVDGGKCL